MWIICLEANAAVRLELTELLAGQRNSFFCLQHTLVNRVMKYWNVFEKNILPVSSITLTILLASLLNWYTFSASPHRAASGVHIWRKAHGGTNKCTATEGSLKTYCFIPYTGSQYPNISSIFSLVVYLGIGNIIAKPHISQKSRFQWICSKFFVTWVWLFWPLWIWGC